MKHVIIDCDPGHDDAIGIVLAAARNNDIDIQAITTVSGNVGIEQTTANALKIVELLEIDAPVAKGSERPIVRQLETAGDFHGETGLDGPELPSEPSSKAIDKHAVDVIIEAVLSRPNEVTVVATGPLTNVAMAMVKEPKIIPLIKEVVIMGGGTFGNWTPTAEFNIWADAEAARIVVESGASIRMFGLNVTHQALATQDVLDDIKEIDNKISRFVSDLLEFFRQTNKDYFDMDAPPVHDPCTIAYLINPSIFTFEHVNLDVETKGEFTYGTTSVDLLHKTGKESNVHFATQLDHSLFWQTVLDAIKSY